MPGPIIHGGNLTEARRRFPAAPDPFIDLSTGINPVPYAYDPIPNEAFTRLPDPASLHALQVAAAKAYRVDDPATVVAAPGTQILISLLPRLLPQPAISILIPTYAEHAASWHAAGAMVHEAADIDAIDRHAAAVICNPNNPDGRRWPPQRLLALASRLDLLVIDEAFADFEPGLSAVTQATRNVVILRSFGKAYGLAGIRLGFALAAPGLASTIRDAIGPWAVSGPAIAIARQALADEAWAERSAARLRVESARLDLLLERAGCEVIGGTTLFRLVHTHAAEALADYLGQQGILVRSFTARPGFLRFGIPAPTEWGRLQDALSGWR